MLFSKKSQRVLFTIAFLCLVLGLSGMQGQQVKAASLRIKMNGKTSYYRGKQSTIYKGTKRISKAKYKGLTIKKTRMAPYDDVFKKGLKVKTKYTSSSKKLVFTKNGVKVTLTLGSKYAYVNGKRYKLTSPAVKVRYVKQKKNKILVPIKFLCKHLGFSYKASGSEIILKEQFVIEYKDGVRKKLNETAKFSFNGKENKLSSMPGIKLGSTVYLPAEETLKKIMGLQYEYDKDTGILQLENKATGKKVEITLNEESMKINGGLYDLSTPMYQITRKDTNKTVLCFPAKKVFQALGYHYKWTKSKALVAVQDLIYFSWKASSSANTSNANTNYITETTATYNPDINSISFSVKGSNATIMNQVSVTRDDKTIRIVIPASSKYCLEQFSFQKFVTTIENYEVVEDGSGQVCINIKGFAPLDFAYTSMDGVFTLNIMNEYVGDYALKIMKPANITMSHVSTEDLYNQKKFKITLQGDHTNFFLQNPIVISSDTVSDVTVVLNSSGNTEITVTTTKLQGYKIFNKSDSLVVAIGNPKEIYKNIVVIDPGHGGYDGGASKNGTKEKNLNYKIGYTLMKEYFSSVAPDTKIYWTRTNDTFITLANRAAFASKVGADMFISLHMNSAASSGASGTEVYYSTNNNSKSFSGVTSKSIATMMKNNLVLNLGMNNRGVKSAGYYVTKHNTVPAILIELGFLSNGSDYAKLIDPVFQRNSAKIMADTIEQIFASYPTGR